MSLKDIGTALIDAYFAYRDAVKGGDEDAIPCAFDSRGNGTQTLGITSNSLLRSVPGVRAPR